MEVQLYIKGQKIDLFNDEKISINLSVKNINDLSKVLTDFTQSFNVPCTKNNNAVFEHWYNADVDGTFNVNIRVEAYLEVNSLPFRYGTLQLDSAKLKDGLPYSYSCTFYGASVSLSDLFGEDQLKNLDSLNQYNHVFDKPTVLDAISEPTLFNGDVYYPLINSVSEMSLQTSTTNDMLSPVNSISYREFKPALRNIRIIEAIEEKYGITLSKDFFDRSVFYNTFLWLNKDAGLLKAFGNEVKVDLQTAGDLDGIQFYVNTTNDTVDFKPNEFFPDAITPSVLIKRDVSIIIIPNIFNLDILYRLKIYRDGIQVNEIEGVGIQELSYGEETALQGNHTFYFTISASANFTYASQLSVKRTDAVLGTSSFFTEERGVINSTAVNLDSEINIIEQLPEIKVKDYFNSLIAQFNLIIKPINPNSFYIDTLDSWYLKGKTYDLNKYINIKEIEVKRPNVKKKIDFLYQKTGTILGAKYFENNQIGYGDLKSTYNISGEDLKIETQFENMLFERLAKEADGVLTELQVGFCLDKELKPYKGKPFMFYRNGVENIESDVYLSGEVKNTFWHTATEDNINITQVTNCLNFGSDVSTYFYTPIEKSLYFNWWKDYIEDLFERKCRVLSISGILPTHILYKIQMNDRLIIQDRRYKISDLKIDLTTGAFTGEVFSDFSQPLDTIDNIVPLTVDATDISVDSDLITVDTISTYSALYSFITNGISIDRYEATKGEEHFEVKVTSNTNWSVINVDAGDGVDWFSVNNAIGNKTNYVRVKVNYNTGSNRIGILRFTIGTETFDLNIVQL